MANRKRGVNYVQQDEPSFITQFKQKVGYKEGPNIDTKVISLSDILGFGYLPRYFVDYHQNTKN